MGRSGAPGGGAALLVAGLATGWWWSWGWILFWAAGTTFIAAGAAFGMLWPRRPRLGRRVFQAELAQGADNARDALMKRLARHELLGEVRTRINTLRAYRFDRTFNVTSSPGLSEIHDSLYEVPTRAALEVENLITNVAGISLGIAGPRGSGKSTIVRHHCGTPSREPQPPMTMDVLLHGRLPTASIGDVRCLVSAPVDYAARDFVLHLFAAFCRRVISALAPAARARPWQRWLLAPHAIVSVVSVAAVRVIMAVLAVAVLLLIAPSPWTAGVAVLTGTISWAALTAGLRPAAGTRSGKVVEVDLRRQVLLLVRDGRVQRVFNTSTGSGRTYSVGGIVKRAVTPRGTFRVRRQVNGWDKGPLGSLYRPRDVRQNSRRLTQNEYVRGYDRPSARRRTLRFTTLDTRSPAEAAWGDRRPANSARARGRPGPERPWLRPRGARW